MSKGKLKYNCENVLVLEMRANPDRRSSKEVKTARPYSADCAINSCSHSSVNSRNPVEWGPGSQHIWEVVSADLSLRGSLRTTVLLPLVVVHSSPPSGTLAPR